MKIQNNQVEKETGNRATNLDQTLRPPSYLTKCPVVIYVLRGCMGINATVSKQIDWGHYSESFGGVSTGSISEAEGSLCVCVAIFHSNADFYYYL